MCQHVHGVFDVHYTYRAITELQQKMGCLQQGLAALLSGNPLPPAAAAALAAALQQTAAKAPAAAAAAGMSSRGEEIQDVISVINQPGAYQDPVQQRQQQQQQLLGTCDTNSSCIMAPVGKVSSASSAAAEAAAREAEIKLASGAYDAQRFEEYNRQVRYILAWDATQSASQTRLASGMLPALGLHPQRVKCLVTKLAASGL